MGYVTPLMCDVKTHVVTFPIGRWQLGGYIAAMAKKHKGKKRKTRVSRNPSGGGVPRANKQRLQRMSIGCLVVVVLGLLGLILPALLTGGE